MKQLLLFYLVTLSLVSQAQLSQPNAIRLYRTGDRFITLTDSIGTSVLAIYPDNQIALRRGGRGLIELVINGSSDYYSPSKLLNGSGLVWGSTVNATLSAWNQSAQITASADKTYLSGNLTISTTLVSLPALPINATRVTIALSGADIVYSLDPSNGPVVSPLRGFRLADGQTLSLAASDAPFFRAVRLANTDAVLYYEAKIPAR